MKISDTLAGSSTAGPAAGIGTRKARRSHVVDLFEVEGLGQIIVGPFFKPPRTAVSRLPNAVITMIGIGADAARSS